MEERKSWYVNWLLCCSSAQFHLAWWRAEGRPVDEPCLVDFLVQARVLVLAQLQAAMLAQAPW
jgi:hypothetical protein